MQLFNVKFRPKMADHEAFDTISENGLHAIMLFRNILDNMKSVCLPYLCYLFGFMFLPSLQKLPLLVYLLINSNIFTLTISCHVVLV